MSTKRKSPTLAQIRNAVADYIGSEGCSCCRGDDHEKHQAALGRLLRVKKYPDGDGYNFGYYRDKARTRNGDSQ